MENCEIYSTTAAIGIHLDIALTNHVSHADHTDSPSDGLHKSTHRSTTDHSWPNSCCINFREMTNMDKSNISTWITYFQSSMFKV